MKQAMDMTSGNSLKQLVSFTIPLILGNVFQLTYNMVDSIVVGRFAGSDALAAVGTADPIMSLIILGVSGMCVGASVLMSQFFGAQRLQDLKDEMQTIVELGVYFSIVIFIMNIFLSKYLLIWMQCPESILSMALVYLRIIFIGMPFNVLYNIYASGLRSIGNSKIPTQYLIFASVLNIVLDILFVTCFHLGVAGAAVATILSIGSSAFGCMYYVSKNVEALHFSWKLHLRKDLIVSTVSYGFFSALQQCAQPIGKLFIQGMVNSLGVSVMAAFNAVGKIEDIGLVPGRSISNSIMTFTAQNKGADQSERMEEGFKKGMILEIGTGFVISFLLFLFRKPLMSIFTDDSSIITAGVSYFSVMFVAYVLSNVSNGNQGYYRGIGYMKTTLYGTLSQITVRVIVTYLFIRIFGLQAIGLGCMAGWIVQLTWQSLYHYYLIKTKSS